MKLRHMVLVAGWFAGAVLAAPALHAAAPPKQPAISEQASAALLHMGETLRAEQYSFQVRTIRVYGGARGELLHIFHTIKVVVHRPNRLLVDVNGDDGESKLAFDGKTATVFSAAQNRYAAIPVPEGTIEAMLKEVVGQLGVDFPLADFLTEAPNKAFLTGVTSGEVVGTVTSDGAPYLHLFFSQPPGIDLELWLADNQQSLPRRLIVTYRDLPGQPNFIALFSDWNFNIHPSDADFTFQPPTGAEQVQLKPPPAAGTAAASKGAKK